MYDTLEYRGRWVDIFLNLLLVSVLSTLTLGIYVPWGYVRFKRVIVTNTYFRGKPLQFDGTGGQAFVQFLIIAALTAVTLGLYAILGYASTRLLRWEYAHTILPTGQRLEYRGEALGLFFENFLIWLLTPLTLGLYFFWGWVRRKRYILTHTYVDNRPLDFTGSGGEYLVLALTNGLFTLVTVGLYALLGFATVRTLAWETVRTVVPVPVRAPQPMPIHSPVLSAFARPQMPAESAPRPGPPPSSPEGSDVPPTV